MKVLIYSFKSKKNISKQVLNKIKDSRQIVKVVFPSKCNKKIFLKTIKATTPDMIIGIGQHENGDKYRIERKAYNAVQRKEDIYSIFSNKPDHYFLSLILKEDNESRYSYDAGYGISNYSMYIISHLCKNVNFAFINLPKDADVEKAAAFVEKKISEAVKSHVLEGEQAGLSNFFKRRKEENEKLIS